MYQLTKDSVTSKLGIDLHTTGAVFLSVIDNLLIAHNVDQQVGEGEAGEAGEGEADGEEENDIDLGTRTHYSTNSWKKNEICR